MEKNESTYAYTYISKNIRNNKYKIFSYESHRIKMEKKEPSYIVMLFYIHM